MSPDEVYRQLADLVHPVEDHDIRQIHFLPHEHEIAEAEIAEADARRDAFVEQIRGACDRRDRDAVFGTPGVDEVSGDEDPDFEIDPVDFALWTVAGEIRVLQARLYELIAYARELSPPGRSYSLARIAAAAGMSPSGVRTSYTATTTDAAAHNLRIGAAKRDGDPDPRWR